MCRGLGWRWLLDLRPLPRAGTQQGPSSRLLLPPGSSSSRWSAGGTHNLESPRHALARLFAPVSRGGKRVSCWGMDSAPWVPTSPSQTFPSGLSPQPAGLGNGPRGCSTEMSPNPAACLAHMRLSPLISAASDRGKGCC